MVKFVRKVRPVNAILCGMLFVAGCSDYDAITQNETVASEVSSSSQKESSLSSAETVDAESSSAKEIEVGSSSAQKNDGESSSAKEIDVESSSANNEAKSSSSNSILDTIGVSQSSCSNAESSSSKVVEPVTEKLFNLEVRSYQYEFAGMDFLALKIVNKENFVLDSFELKLFFTAKPEDVEAVAGQNSQAGSCPLTVDADICQAYDEAGFSDRCKDAEGGVADVAIREALRKSVPVKLSDTYNASTGEYDWYVQLPLATAIIKANSSVRMDVGFSSGVYQNGTCEILRSSAKKRFLTPNSKDWSWKPHTALADGVDFDGMLVEDKDYMDLKDAPVNPYIAVYRQDVRVWGNIPRP